MKFKIGDKVRILPSATDGGVGRSSVGEIGKVVRYNEEYGYFLVIMNPQDLIQPAEGWAVFPNQMEQVVKVGQQLLFDFMVS